jgi:hypothetical protein
LSKEIKKREMEDERSEVGCKKWTEREIGADCRHLTKRTGKKEEKERSLNSESKAGRIVVAMKFLPRESRKIEHKGVT